MKSLFISAILVAGFTATYCQEDSSLIENNVAEPVIKDASPIVMPAGKQYRASSWKQLWWGKHYRKEWTTPVEFPILKLNEIDGGLKPIKAGGGHQTKTLRLLSTNGREYVLRTIDKSLDVLVPEYLKGTYINDIVNDQISTAHPYGPVAISRMAESISIFHTNPKIYYVPADPRLVEFENIFANKLCLLEERPSGKGWEQTEQFGYATDIVNTEKMLEKVFSSSKYNVDQQTFLTVRLFDMLVNDWDRHEDQWIWALKKGDRQRVFIPIARDRDQSFSKTDGIYLYFLSRRWAFRPLQNLDPHIKDVRGANFSARNLDRQFLNELNRDAWKQGITLFQNKLTDSAIRNAVYSMPPEVNKISGDYLTKRLSQRRNNLDRDGLRYYSILSKQIVVSGSDDGEAFHIAFQNKNTASVTGLRSINDTFYHRVFYRNETKDISIYGLGGDDRFVLQGEQKNKFKIRLVGGAGDNYYVSFNDAIRGKRPHIYDSLQLSSKHQKGFKTIHRWDSLYTYNRRSVKYDWYLPLIIPEYNQDDGLYIGAGLLYKRQMWGKTPFGWQQSLLINYATGTSAFGVSYKGLFKQTFGKWDLDINTFYKGHGSIFNYYGFGNETELNGYDRNYFRVKANDFYFNPGISRSWQKSSLKGGLQYEAVKILESQNKFATSPGSQLDSTVFSVINFGGINGEWKSSNLGYKSQKEKGFEFTFGFSYEHNLDNTDRKLLNLNSSIALYFPISKSLLLAHRTGGGTIFGDYEFYQANTLGGHQNLRGYWRDRFTGKSNFYQNTELRWTLANLNGCLLRGKLGLLGFFDDGRVWAEDDNSSVLHTGYGGGLFLLPYNAAAFTLYYSHSKEVNMITVKSSFFF